MDEKDEEGDEIIQGQPKMRELRDVNIVVKADRKESRGEERRAVSKYVLIMCNKEGYNISHPRKYPLP